jgi:hypothetical protein
MPIVWIASLVTVGIGVIGVLYATTRKRSSSVELGNMSNNWVAEQRSNEHSYHDR